MQPVQIHGVERFCSEVQRWTCAATPIWHPTNSELLGILDISGSAKIFNPQSLAFACAVGRQIETALAQSIKEEHERLLRYSLGKRSHWLTEDIVVIDRCATVLFPSGPDLRVLERRNPGLIREGRISSLEKVPIVVWPAHLTQLVPGVTTELVVNYSRAIGAILVLHKTRRKSVPTITSEEMRAVLARERELSARQRTIELAKANQALQRCLDSLASVPELDELLGQMMTAITRQLGAASSVLRLRDFERNCLTIDRDPISRIQRAVELANFGLAEARRCARNLRLSTVEESGLAVALQRLVESSNVADRLRCNFRSNIIPEETLPPRVRHELLRIAQEAVHNAVRHANPTVIRVTLQWDAPNLVLQVRDHGSGIAAARLEASEGLGLGNMRERASEIGGRFEIQTAAGRGTNIIVTLPILVI